MDFGLIMWYAAQAHTTVHLMYAKILRRHLHNPDLLHYYRNKTVLPPLGMPAKKSSPPSRFVVGSGPIPKF